MNHSNFNNPLHEYIKMRDRIDRAMRQHANPAARLGTAINIVSTNSMDIFSNNAASSSAVALNKMSERALFSSSDTINNFLNSIEKIATLNQNILYYQVPKSIEKMCINSSEHLFETTVAFDLPEPISNDITVFKEELQTSLKTGPLTLDRIISIISLLIALFSCIQDSLPNKDTKELIEINQKQLKISQEQLKIDKKQLEISQEQPEIDKKNLEISNKTEQAINELAHNVNEFMETIIKESELTD